MIQITGNELRSMMDCLKMTIQSLTEMFQQHEMYFPVDESGDIVFPPSSDSPRNICNISEKIVRYSQLLAKLQTERSRYNSTVVVADKDGNSCTLLTELIALEGIYAKEAGRWQRVYGTSDRERRYGDDRIRRADEITAKQSVSRTDALNQAKHYIAYRDQIKALIAKANAIAITVSILTDADLLIFEESNSAVVS